MSQARRVPPTRDVKMWRPRIAAEIKAREISIEEVGRGAYREVRAKTGGRVSRSPPSDRRANLHRPRMVL